MIKLTHAENMALPRCNRDRAHLLFRFVVDVTLCVGRIELDRTNGSSTTSKSIDRTVRLI